MHARRRMLWVGLLAGAVSALGVAAPAAAAPPANDNFANATVIGPSPPISTTGDTTDATAETGEPSPFNQPVPPAEQTVWFTWTAPVSGVIRVDICSGGTSAGDGRVMEVYTGSAVNSLTRVTSGLGDCLQLFRATAATTYRIQVDGRSPTTAGTFALSLTRLNPPANDDFADAVDLGGSLPFSRIGTNVDATIETNEVPASPISASDHTVWYAWTPPAAARVTIDTCTSSFDSTLGVYTGAAVSALSTVAADDDACAGPNGLGSSVTFDASAGTAYRIAVGGQSNGDQGSFTLTGAAVVPPVVNPPVQNPPAAKKCKKGFKKIKGKCKKNKKRKRKK